MDYICRFCMIKSNLRNTDSSTHGLLQRLDFDRILISNQLNRNQKSKMGQFMTPISIASFMASLFDDTPCEHVQLLDPGAGIGSLTSAFVVDHCQRKNKPLTITVKAYEIDSLLFDNLEITLQECKRFTEDHSVQFAYEIRQEDFIKDSVELLQHQLFEKKELQRHTHIIMNPPYHKIRSDSEHRELLSRVQIETSNLYTAFLALGIHLIRPEGQLVAITPRSFCNGPYFLSFRHLLNEHMSLRNIHVFESRNQTFDEEDVLQENIIFHAIKTKTQKPVTVTSSSGKDFQGLTTQQVSPSMVMDPKDRDLVIHIPTSELDQHVLERIHCFQYTLDELGIDVSTGRVVDFRAQDHLCNEPQQDAVPLIYPHHFDNGFVVWPNDTSKKPNAIRKNTETDSLFVPAGHYVLVRRFSSKEEPKRINTALCDPAKIPNEELAFENHVNYFHMKHRGLPPHIARGLKVYLDSTLVDLYFRHFNGHTQVNAADLRMLRYPSAEVLARFGRCFEGKEFNQERIDEIIEKEAAMTAKINSPDPVKAKRKIEEAIDILTALGFPRAQLNERSGLTLLALLDLKPIDRWSKAKALKIGITPIMDFSRRYYGRNYAPNTRETFRRQTMHQFVAAGLAVENPDDPKRPVNSPYWCYQIEPAALQLIQSYKTKQWKNNLKTYLEGIETLKAIYAKKRDMKMIPVVFASGDKVKLTPGKHNELIREIIDHFAQRFAPGSTVLYLGDAGKKWGYFNREAFAEMGITIDEHGKMPDVVLYDPKKDWILLVEAVTSHGPVNSKRRAELVKLFRPVKDKLIFVTAFPDRSTMSNYLKEISWETEVWVAEDPSHMIHFNGNRFLGPY